jgi:hypothetical protein
VPDSESTDPVSWITNLAMVCASAMAGQTLYWPTGVVPPTAVGYSHEARRESWRALSAAGSRIRRPAPAHAGQPDPRRPYAAHKIR